MAANSSKYFELASRTYSQPTNGTVIYWDTLSDDISNDNKYSS